MSREIIVERLMNGENISATEAAHILAEEELVTLKVEAVKRVVAQKAQADAAARRETLIKKLLSLDAEVEQAVRQLAENDTARLEATRPFDERELSIRQKWHEQYVEFTTGFRELCGSFVTEGGPKAEQQKQELKEQGAALNHILIDIGRFPLSPTAMIFVSNNLQQEKRKE